MSCEVQVFTFGITGKLICYRAPAGCHHPRRAKPCWHRSGTRTPQCRCAGDRTLMAWRHPPWRSLPSSTLLGPTLLGAFLRPLSWATSTLLGATLLGLATRRAAWWPAHRPLGREGSWHPLSQKAMDTYIHTLLLSGSSA
jgi:hypothetical protein